MCYDTVCLQFINSIKGNNIMHFFGKHTEKIIFFYSISMFFIVHTSDVFNPFRDTHKVRIERMHGNAILLTVLNKPNYWAMKSLYPDNTCSYNASPLLVAKKDTFNTFAEKKEQVYGDLFEQLTPRQKRIHDELLTNS